MVTRRSPLKSRAGRKSFSVAGASGALVGVPSKRVHAREMHRMSAAELGSRIDAVENRVYRAGRRMAKLGRYSMQEAVGAAKSVRRSLNQAAGAVKRAARNIGREVSAATEATWPTVRTLKASARKASRPAA